MPPERTALVRCLNCPGRPRQESAPPCLRQAASAIRSAPLALRKRAEPQPRARWPRAELEGKSLPALSSSAQQEARARATVDRCRSGPHCCT
eukprot:3800235-Alexandrium_andersonii.AAC.1